MLSEHLMLGFKTLSRQLTPKLHITISAHQQPP